MWDGEGEGRGGEGGLFVLGSSSRDEGSSSITFVLSGSVMMVWGLGFGVWGLGFGTFFA